MKQKLGIRLITYLAYCVDKELRKAVDYLKEQVRVLQEQPKRTHAFCSTTSRGSGWRQRRND